MSMTGCGAGLVTFARGWWTKHVTEPWANVIEILPTEKLEPWEHPTAALALLPLALCPVKEGQNSGGPTLYEYIVGESPCIHEAYSLRSSASMDEQTSDAEVAVKMLESWENPMWENPAAALALMSLSLEGQSAGLKRSSASMDEQTSDAEVAVKMLESWENPMWENPAAALALMSLSLEGQSAGLKRVKKELPLTDCSAGITDSKDGACAKSFTVSSLDTYVPSDGDAFSDDSASDDESEFSAEEELLS